jgi:hypothetical protein
MSRHCKTCNEEHLLEDFRQIKDKYTSVDGNITHYISYRCKKNLNSDKNKAKKREGDKLYRAKNKEKKKIYNDSHREQINNSNKKYYQKNNEVIKQKQKEFNTKDSTKIKIKARRQTIDGTLLNLIRQKRYHNKKHKQTCDFDSEYLKLLIQNQNAKCTYCDHDLEITSGDKSFAQISIDRIDSSKLYFKDNIHITCLFCNLAKNDMDDSLYRKFIGTLKGIPYNFEYEENKSIITTRVSDCKASDKKNNFNPENTITTDQAKELLIKQDNKCAISGLEFINCKGSKSPWKVSIDRLDSNKGHTLENCQLVLMSINFGKSNKTNDEVIQYVKEIMQAA